MEANGIVALKADKTDESTSGPVNELLKELGNEATAIPYYAIYRPGEEPFHFNGVFVTSQLMLEKISPYVLGEDKRATASKAPDPSGTPPRLAEN